MRTGTVSIPAPRARLRATGLARFVALELAIWASVYGAYLAVRGAAIGSAGEAVGHALDVVTLERAIGIFHEASVQSLLAPAERFFSAYYMLAFGPGIVLVAVWLGLRDRRSYRALRNALVLSIAIATVVFISFPTAPPRLVGGLGIEDTVGLAGHDTGSFLGIRFNPYAAVPSMHVGWTLLVATYAFRATRRFVLRAAFALHPVLMAVAVTATGNHFLLDSVAGVAVACLTLALVRLRRRPAYPRLRAVPDSPTPRPAISPMRLAAAPRRLAAVTGEGSRERRAA